MKISMKCIPQHAQAVLWISNCMHRCLVTPSNAAPPAGRQLTSQATAEGRQPLSACPRLLRSDLIHISMFMAAVHAPHFSQPLTNLAASVLANDTARQLSRHPIHPMSRLDENGWKPAKAGQRRHTRLPVSIPRFAHLHTRLPSSATNQR